MESMIPPSRVQADQAAQPSGPAPDAPLPPDETPGKAAGVDTVPLPPRQTPERLPAAGQQDAPRGSGRAVASILGVAACTLLAAVLRLAFLDNVLDFNADEAMAAVFGQRILHGDWRYFTGGTQYVGPAYPALVALAMRVFGENVVAVRLVNAAGNLVVVPAAYLLARTVFRHRGAGLAAALLAAVFPLHVGLSRLAYPTTLLPAVDALALVFLLSFYRRGGMARALPVGLLLGLGLQLHALQYPFLLALGAEFLWRRRWRQTGAAPAALVIPLVLLQWPVLLTPALDHLLGALPERRVATPSLALPAVATLFANVRVLLAVLAGAECADLGARFGSPAAMVLLSLPALLAAAAGGVLLRRAGTGGPLLWVLPAAALAAAAMPGVATGQWAWQQRYLSLLAPVLLVLMGGVVAWRGRRVPAWAPWTLVAVVAVCQTGHLWRTLNAQRRAPQPVTELRADLPGLLARRPSALVVENWWIYWPTRFFVADRLPVFSPQANLYNPARPVPGARPEAVWIGWNAETQGKRWYPNSRSTPARFRVRVGAAGR